VDAQVALASLSEITDVMLAAHGRGLVHGSVVAGNVLVRRGSTSLFLVDFGLAPLLAGLEDHASTAADDLAGLDVLATARRRRRGGISYRGGFDAAPNLSAARPLPSTNK
jgi:serine/threonine protein kinase